MSVLHSTKFVNLVQAQPKGFLHPWVWARRNQDSDGQQTKGGVVIAALIDRDNAVALATNPENPIRVSGKDIFFLKTKRPSLIEDHGFEYSLELAAGLNPSSETIFQTGKREAESELGRQVRRIEVVGENNCSSSGITSELQHFAIAEVGDKEQPDIVDRRERTDVIQEIIRVPVEKVNEFLKEQEQAGVCVSALARAGLSFVLDRLAKEREQKLTEVNRSFGQVKTLVNQVISSLVTMTGLTDRSSEHVSTNQLKIAIEQTEKILVA